MDGITHSMYICVPEQRDDRASKHVAVGSVASGHQPDNGTELPILQILFSLRLFLIV